MLSRAAQISLLILALGTGVASVWDTLATTWGENGCWVDPNGGCAPLVEVDNGCRVDPSGSCID